MSKTLTPGTLFADRYQILECLGRGGMGTVYSAQHTALEKKFAIKLLHRDLCVNSSALTRFAQEARSASGIEHQNIIDVLDAGRIDDHAFYVMEYLKGEDLQTLFTRESPLPWERVQRIVLQICDAMQAAHDRRIIHRDLKPSNLYRITRGSNSDFIKILDFGIAKVRTAADETRDGLTAVGSILGTLKYMAPEQARGLKIDHRADIYALGVILYQALTGGLPFKGSQPAELIQKLVNDEPLPMREHVEGVPTGIEMLVRKALSKDPSDRFPSMLSLASAIERFKPNDSPPPRRVVRAPIIAADDSSIELVVETPAHEMAMDITTVVRAPRRRRTGSNEADVPIDRPRSRPYARAMPGTSRDPAANEIDTETGAPVARKNHMWSFAPWLLATALAGFTLQHGSTDSPVSDDALQLKQFEVSQPTVVPAPLASETVPPPRSPTKAVIIEPSAPGKQEDKQPPSATPHKNIHKKVKSPEPEPEPELEVDCSSIRANTMVAERNGEWAILYLLADSPCWANDLQALEWRVKAKTELQQFEDCIKLGKGVQSPRIARMVKLCETRALMEVIK